MKRVMLLPILLAVIINVSAADTPNSSLPTVAFYVVSEEQIEGGRFIDTKEFPKLGYIRRTPDLALTALEAVTVANDVLGKFVREQQNRNGGLAGLGSDWRTLYIKLLPEDARKFEVLTKNNLGKRILLMLGEQPLTAPLVGAPINYGIVPVTFGNYKRTEKLEAAQKELGKLVRGQ